MQGVHIGASGERYEGTVRPAANFNAEADSQVLRKAMKGLGTDEKAITDIVALRSNAQRLEIKRMFKTMFGKDLIAELRGELSGHFRDLVIGLFEDPDIYDARCLRRAIKGAGTQEGVLTEILTTRTNAEIQRIKLAYKKILADDEGITKRDLEEDIAADTSGYYKRVLISCLQANRSELTPDQLQRLQSQGVEAIIDRNLARQEAMELHQAGAKRLGTDESTFIRIIAIRNIYQLRATFEEYHKLAGSDILAAISSEMSGDLCTAMKSLALSVINRPQYFAERLHGSMKGLGTKDDTLVRVIITRSEIDLANTKQEFQRNYHQSLTEYIRGDTSGDYQKLLLALVGA